MTGAILRLVLEYPREWENLIDEPALRRAAEPAFEFHLVKRPQIEARARLAGDQTIGSLTPLELLDLYWRSINTKTNDTETLNDLASRVIQAVHGVETENPEKSPSHT
jgi:DNA repair protein SbcD/Mre11